MKKPLLKWMMISLLAGVFLNLLIVLICTFAGHLWPGAVAPATAAQLPSLHAEFGNLPTSVLLGGRAERFGYSELRLYAQGRDHGTDENQRLDLLVTDVDIIDIAAGWPMKSFQRRIVHRQVHGVSDDPRDPMISRRLRLDPWRLRRDIVFPVNPIWRGVAANSLVFAAITFTTLALLQSKTALRRLRVIRGLCPCCAYPIGVSARCTECGEPLPARVER